MVLVKQKLKISGKIAVMWKTGSISPIPKIRATLGSCISSQKQSMLLPVDILIKGLMWSLIYWYKPDPGGLGVGGCSSPENTGGSDDSWGFLQHARAL